MNQTFNNGNGFNASFKPAGEPEMPKPWRPELQSMQGPAAESDSPTDVETLGLVGQAGVPGEDELAMVAGGPSRFRASMSRANLMLFGLFLLGVGIVAFMSLKKGPQAVSAEDKVGQSNVNSAIEKFLASHGAAPAAAGHKNAGGSETKKLINDTRRIVDLFLNFTTKKQVPLENLRTNPFKFDATADAVKNSPKAIADKKADEEARKKRIEQAKAAFKKLQLQTVIAGPAGRQAMVNSQIVKTGDSIEGFKVVDIQDRNVTLTFEEMSFTLEMGY